MTELRPETRSMLAAARSVHDPLPGAKARMRRSLRAGLGLGATAATTAATTTVVSNAAAGSAVFGVGTKLLVALAFVAAGGVWTAKYVEVTHTEEVVHPAAPASVAPPAPLPRASAPVVSPPVAPAPSVTAAPPPPVRVAPLPSAAPAPRPEPSAPSIAAEVALLANARSSLAAGDPARAMDAVDEHARRFPDGALREERDLERVDALCALGAVDEATRVARAFARDYPRSPLLPRVRASCAKGE